MRPWWGTALRKGGLWIEPDGFLKLKNGLGEFFLFLQSHAKARMGRHTVGPDTQGLFKMLRGFGHGAAFCQHSSQVDVGQFDSWIDAQGFLVQPFRLYRIALFFEGRPQVHFRERVLGIHLERVFPKRDAVVPAPHLEKGAHDAGADQTARQRKGGSVATPSSRPKARSASESRRASSGSIVTGGSGGSEAGIKAL